MIKILATALRSPQIFLPLALFAIGGLIISSAWNLYGEQAHRELPNAEVQPKGNGAPSMQEIRTKITQSSSRKDEHFEVIAEKNLFTSNRQAWQPPKKESSDHNGDQEENDSKKQAAKIHQISRSKIRLYGTTMTDAKNMALMYMEPFESKRKYYTVHEGEVIRDEGERGEWLYFKVSSVATDSVTLEDPEGETFEVGLFDHQREQKKTASRDTSGIQITVGGEEEGERSAGSQDGGEGDKEKTDPDEESGRGSEDTRSASDENDQESEETEDTSKEAESPEESDEKEGPRNLADILKKLGNRREGGDQSSGGPEQRERQVEEGNKRTIETPFGTITRPAD